MTRPNWSRVNARFFPDFTCPASRHVKVISEVMRKGQMRDALDGWDPEHMAEALEFTVQDLWEARKLLTEAGYERVEVRGKWVWRKRKDTHRAFGQPTPSAPPGPPPPKPTR